MTLFQSIILAIVQGLTEFLPVSSSGHLVLLQKLFGIEKPPVFFDILLHLGTLIAILVFFKNEILFLFEDWKSKINIWLLLIVGSIPAAIFGLILNSQIEIIFNSLSLVGVSWVIMGCFLLFTKKFKNVKEDKLEKIKKTDALMVGLFQAIALLPGISRSGSTIFGGLWRRMSPETAFSFSFLLSVPAVLGAVFLEATAADFSQINLMTSLLLMTAAGVVGYFSLKALKKVLVSGKLFYFGFYCLGLGIIVLIFN